MSHEDDFRPITADGVRAAARRIAGVAVRTPLVENDFLNEITGGRVFLKAEVLQHCGSFKFRGAYNRLSQLTEDERHRGVLAWSSGNHAQGVARAATLLGVPAVIVMPEDAPATKTEKVKRLGAEIITYDRYSEDREKIGRPIAAERGLALAPSYDHPDIIEGQGTLALETLEDLAGLGVSLDAFLICCGGGGMTAGCATLLGAASPSTEVWIAEPKGFDESWASIATGERRHADITQKTICDAIATPTPGKLTLPILQSHVKAGFAVSEDEVLHAMAWAWRHLKLVVEPGGAVALAALLLGKADVRGKTVAATLSGGNVDAPVFERALGFVERL
ncbi:MAG: threonine/serine dehydratase [Pseudomonadota bacterium]